MGSVLITFGPIPVYRKRQRPFLTLLIFQPFVLSKMWTYQLITRKLLTLPLYVFKVQIEFLSSWSVVPGHGVIYSVVPHQTSARTKWYFVPLSLGTKQRCVHRIPFSRVISKDSFTQSNSQPLSPLIYVIIVFLSLPNRELVSRFIRLFLLSSSLILVLNPSTLLGQSSRRRYTLTSKGL